MASLPHATGPASAPAYEGGLSETDARFMERLESAARDLESGVFSSDQDFSLYDCAMPLSSDGDDGVVMTELFADADDALELLPLTAADAVWLAETPSAVESLPRTPPTPTSVPPSPLPSTSVSEPPSTPPPQRRKARPLSPSYLVDEFEDVDDVDDASSEYDSDAVMVIVNAPPPSEETRPGVSLDEGDPTVLPDPPAAHPHNGRTNYYEPPDSDEEIDPEREYPVYALLDRRGQRPYRCYLVHWVDHEKRFIGTWEWETRLRGGSLDVALDWLDRWKDEFQTLSYATYRRRYPMPFTASTSDFGSARSCFYRALILACHVLKDPTLVLEEHIDSFIAREAEKHKNGSGADSHVDGGDLAMLDRGVTAADIERFTKHLIKEKAGLAGQVFKKNHISSSLSSVAALNDYELFPGVYVVGASCERGMRHCFVLHVPADFGVRTVYYDFDLVNPQPEPLTTLEWIRSVQFAQKVQRVGKMKRATMSKPKAKKKKTKTEV